VNGGFEVDDIVASTSGEEEMATYSIFRHTTWRTHAMISRYIGNWGCCACTLLAFPALALSTLTCMRQRKATPKPSAWGFRTRTFGRIRCSGRINNVFLSLYSSVHSTIEPSSFVKSLPSGFRQSVANSQSPERCRMQFLVDIIASAVIGKRFLLA